MTTANKIFISYRREDTATITGRIYDWLTGRVPKEDVFFDVDLEYGVDFVRRIQTTIAQCKAMLVVIGPHWLNEKGAPSPYVRMEVEGALALGPSIHLFPVLVDGARMPSADQLPEGMRALTVLNAATIGDGRNFTRDIEDLARDLAKTMGAPLAARLTARPTRAGAQHSTRRQFLLAGAASVVGLAGVGWWITSPFSPFSQTLYPRPSGAWHTWADRIAGPVAFRYAPAAVRSSTSRIDILALGEDGRMYHTPGDGSIWQGFTPIPAPGGLASGPALASPTPNQLDAFVFGTDNQLYHNFFDGQQWNSWLDPLSAPFDGISSPAAIATGDSAQRVDVFFREANGNIYHASYNTGASASSGWGGIEKLGLGSFISGPSATSSGPHRLDVFGIGTDQFLYHNYFDGSWHDWSERAGAAVFKKAAGPTAPTLSPAAASWAPGSLDVMGISVDGRMLHGYRDGGSAWSAYEPTGNGGFYSSPALVSMRPGRLDAFVLGGDGAIYHNYWE